MKSKKFLKILLLFVILFNITYTNTAIIRELIDSDSYDFQIDVLNEKPSPSPFHELGGS